MSQSLSRNEHFAAPTKRAPRSLSSNLNRLISAAVVNPRFRNLLLVDPISALALGYHGENFQLTAAEYAAVTSLRASTMQEFAAQLLQAYPLGEDAPGDFQNKETMPSGRERITDPALARTRWQDVDDDPRQPAPVRRIGQTFVGPNLSSTDAQRTAHNAPKHEI